MCMHMHMYMCMQVGKGRSTNLMEINAFFAKLTAGTAAS